MTDRKFIETPSQTAGPYVHIGCVPNFCGIKGVYAGDPGWVIVNEKTKGERVTVRGTIFDAEGAPLLDAMIEVWQADADGIYAAGDADFSGWGRRAGDYETGEWTFETIKPGRVPYHDGPPMAPHIGFWIVARGINLGLNTRMYFPDELEANAEDPVLALVDAARVPSLVAVKESAGQYRFDIYLQGENETVFFDV